MSTKQKLTDLLADLSGEDQAKIKEAVDALVEEVESSTRTELQNEYSETADKMTRLAQQRDENLGRAQDAEKKACESIEERNTLIAEAREDGIKEVEEQLEALQKEYDDLEESLTESIEAKYNDKLVARTKKISRFLDANLNVVAEALREEMSKDPMVVRETAAFRRIADLVNETASKNDGSIIEHPGFQKIQSESIALRAEIQALQGRNTRLNEEVTTLRNDVNETRQSSPDTNDAKPNSSDRKPPRDEKVSGGTPLKPDVDPVNSRTVPNTNSDDNTAANNESAGDVQESVSDVIDTSKTESPTQHEAPRVSRASDLLREVFDKKKAATKAVQKSATADGWADGGSNLHESRGTRIERASNVTGRGELINEQDILTETSETTTRPGNTGRIIPGTDSTLSEVLKLAGVSID